MKCQVLVDWLTFSVKATDPREVIRNYLGLDPDLFQDAGYGLLGYQQVLRFGDICVCYEPRQNDYFQDMGVCVSMSGNGCRAFETMSHLQFAGARDKQGMDSIAFPVLFQMLNSDEGANISRLDIACDDREGHLDMDEIIRKVQSNEVNSRLRKRSVLASYNGSERSGSTVYIGAPSSDFRVRIYDKALEEGVAGHWIRVELVLRGSNANAFVSQIVNFATVGKLAAQVMNDKFSFIDRDDSNITRCSVCPWWLSFVDDLEAVRLVAREVVQHTVEQIDRWVFDQVGPSLAVLCRTVGRKHLFDLVEDAGKRLSPKQQAVISDYNHMKAAYRKALRGVNA